MIGPAPRVAVPALSRSERSCVSPSVAPVRRSGSIARRNARSRAVVTTSNVTRPIRLSQGRRTPAPGGLDNQRQAGRAYLATRGAEGPPKAAKRGRLWLTDGSCIRLRPEQRNHVWSHDFVEDRTHEGRKYRMLNVLDEFTHECLTI